MRVDQIPNDLGTGHAALVEHREAPARQVVPAQGPGAFTETDNAQYRPIELAAHGIDEVQHFRLGPVARLGAPMRPDDTIVFTEGDERAAHAGPKLKGKGVRRLTRGSRHVGKVDRHSLLHV